jgi:uncharacterized membrane protein
LVPDEERKEKEVIQRLTDYGIVLVVVLVLMSLFKLSRFILHKFTNVKATAGSDFNTDCALIWGLRFLLTGLLLLPFLTSILAFFDNEHLPGGMTLHLVLTAISVVLFSLAEDLFRDYNSYGSVALKSVSWHVRRSILPLSLFWAVGCVFISPLFYSGLTILVAVFYRMCLSFRRLQPGISSNGR